MVWGSAAFGSYLGQEGGAHMNGISALIKETPESSHALSALWAHREKLTDCRLEEGSHPDLALQLPELWRVHVCGW